MVSAALRGCHDVWDNVILPDVIGCYGNAECPVEASLGSQARQGRATPRYRCGTAPRDAVGIQRRGQFQLMFVRTARKRRHS